MENTIVNIYNRPAYASIGLGTIEIVLALIAFLANIANPFEKSNKGFFIGFAAMSDIVGVGMAYLLAVILIIFGIVIIRLGIHGLKADKPFIAIIGISQGTISILMQIAYLITITIQTVEMYKNY